MLLGLLLPLLILDININWCLNNALRSNLEGFFILELNYARLSIGL